jgi:hypothetical protein
MKSLYFLCCVFAFVTAKAQNTKPCSAPQIKQFDFWIGDWDLTWSDTLHGTNWIEKIMDGCTLQANFYDPITNMLEKAGVFIIQIKRNGSKPGLTMVAVTLP